MQVTSRLTCAKVSSFLLSCVISFLKFHYSLYGNVLQFGTIVGSQPAAYGCLVCVVCECVFQCKPDEGNLLHNRDRAPLSVVVAHGHV